MRILISWLAYNNDFKDGHPYPDGPTMQFHQYFFDHDLHLLLSTDDNPRHGLLLTALKNSFPYHKVEGKILHIADVIDFRELKTKVESLLLEYRDHELDLFFSPGTSAMQLTWFICHHSLGLRTRLIQTRPAKFSIGGQPELLYLDLLPSELPKGAVIRESRNRMVDYEIEQDYLITESLKPVYDQAYLAAQAGQVTVQIYGPTGSGKEHLAHFIHQHSNRKEHPFLAVNCSAFSDQLLESRLFGHKKGAFTGAVEHSKGVFQQASGGTVFLDEIGDISPYMQQSLLRVLQEKEIIPVGGGPLTVDVRIIAATNKDLAELCEQGKFRWDLYYRLAVVELFLPSLLERGPHEIRLLIDHFLQLKKHQFKKSGKISLTNDTYDFLTSYHWPGNVRELENVIESLYVMDLQEITIKNLPARIKRSSSKISLLLADVERAHVQKVLDLHQGNQKKAARALGIAVNTLKSKLK